MTAFALVLAAIAAAAAAQPAAGRGSVAALTVGEPVTAIIGSRQRVQWSVVLERQQFAEITLTVTAARGEATVTNAAGEVVARSGPLREFSNAWINLEGRGRFTIGISVEAISSRPAEVKVILASARDVQPSDRQRLEAQRAFAQGAAARFAARADPSRAARAYQRAAVLLDALDARFAGETHLALAHLYEQQSDFDKADASVAASAAAFATAGDSGGQARAQRFLAELRLATGNEAGALAAQRAALELWRAAGDTRGVAIARADLATSNADGVAEDDVERVLRSSIDILREAGDPLEEATVRKALANRAHADGRSTTALERYEDALRSLGGLDEPRLEADIRNDFGVLYNALGDFSLADAQLRRAVVAAERSGVGTTVAHSLMNFGTNQADLHDFAAATRTLEQARRRFAALGETAVEATILNNLGSIYHDRGDDRSALAAVVAARHRFADAGNRRGEMIAGTSVGRLQCATAQPSEGIAQLQRARELARDRADENQQALILSLLGQCEAAKGDLDAALQYTSQAMASVESLRAQFGREDLRLNYAASAQPIIERHVAVLMARHAADPDGGWSAAAFETSERYRARAFLEETTRRRIQQVTLAANERRERDRLIAAIRGAPDDVAAADRLNAYYAWLSRSAGPEPDSADLRRGALSIDDARAAIGSNAVALVYMLGERRGDVWLLDAERLTHAELPPRRTIEQAVAEFRGQIRRRTSSATEAAQRGADEDIEHAAARLSALVLRPVAKQLRGQKIYLVADGALQAVPFAVLPAPDGKGQPLIQTHEIVAVPSLTVLKALAERPRGRLDDVTVFADPIYDPGDPRLGAPAAAAFMPRGPSAAIPLARLPWTADEAAAIAATARPRRVETLTGAAVTRSNLVSALARRGTVHIAGHGIMDDVRDERSAIVLSLFDERGRPVDGFLRAIDVETLTIASDLVVLSACDTAVGREAAGEGMLGLTRAFLVAGAPQVIGSLWNVRDAATAELMASFYGSLLVQGSSPSAALRDAQLALARVPRWRSLYFWGAFVITGP